MAFLLLIPLWLLVLSLVAGLCRAARFGDRDAQDLAAMNAASAPSAEASAAPSDGLGPALGARAYGPLSARTTPDPTPT
jgi:hypothetical protein